MLRLYDVKEMDLTGLISWEQHFKLPSVKRANGINLENTDFDTDLIVVDNDISDKEMNNLRSLWLDEKYSIVARFMPVMHEYSHLSNAERSDFLSDKITMIEYISGDEITFSLNQGELFFDDKKNGEISEKFFNFFKDINIDVERSLKKLISFINNRMEGNCSIVFTLSDNGDIYLTSVLRNTIDIRRMKEREINFILNNIENKFISLIHRPIHFTTSLNESNHKANIEWLMESQGNYCLLLNHFKRG
jgi:hypothetical protein